METINITFPIPLSDGAVVTINNIPVQLKVEDAEKISRVVLALAEKKPVNVRKE